MDLALRKERGCVKGNSIFSKFSLMIVKDMVLARFFSIKNPPHVKGSCLIFRQQNSAGFALWHNKFHSMMELSARISGRCRMLSASVSFRITLHGTPAAKLPAGISLVTTLPAPMTQLSPIVTPGQTVTEAPNQQSFPICTGLA